MFVSKLSRLLMPAFLVPTLLLLLPGSISHAVITQTDPSFVTFEAGDYGLLFNPPPLVLPDIASEIVDNGDGTLTTTVEGDGLGFAESLVTYDIDFTSPGDYYLYFLEDGGGALFLNHGTGFGTTPGKEEDDDAIPGISEDWNSLDNGWNGLFEIGDGLGGNRNYTVDPLDGRPEWSWPVDATMATPGTTTSFTVRSNEDGINWQNFVFSKDDNLDAGELYTLAGVSPPDAPPRIEFRYDSTPGGERILSAFLDTTGAGGPGILTFSGVMPDPATTTDPNPSLTPAGSIGSITTATNSPTLAELQAGAQPGLSWAGQSVSLIANDSGNIYEITVPMKYGPDDEVIYTLPEGGVGEAFQYDWVQTFSDNADSNLATVTDAVTPIFDPTDPDARIEVQLATWTGSQRESDGSFAFVAGADGPRLSIDGDGSGNAADVPDDLAIYFGWRRRADLDGGSIQWDSTDFHGFMPVTLRQLAVMTSTPIPEIDIDIKHESFPNSVNLKSNGLLPVSILGTDNFDVDDPNTGVDITTLLFGDPELIDGDGTALSPVRIAFEDVNGDGFLDLSLKFSVDDLVESGALGPDTIEGTLIGALFDATLFKGIDSIRIVPGSFLPAPAPLVAAVPEPSTLALTALGLLGIGWRRRKRA